MKKRIASFLRRMADRLSSDQISGHARMAVNYIPYYNIDNYRSLMLSGAEESAGRMKQRMCSLAEMNALVDVESKMHQRGIIRLEHNLGTQDRIVDGVRCQAEGVTVIIDINRYRS